MCRGVDGVEFRELPDRAKLVMVRDRMGPDFCLFVFTSYLLNLLGNLGGFFSER